MGELLTEFRARISFRRWSRKRGNLCVVGYEAYPAVVWTEYSAQWSAKSPKPMVPPRTSCCCSSPLASDSPCDSGRVALKLPRALQLRPFREVTETAIEASARRMAHRMAAK